jgi:hypothetical protein
MLGRFAVLLFLAGLIGWGWQAYCEPINWLRWGAVLTLCGG